MGRRLLWEGVLLRLGGGRGGSRTAPAGWAKEEGVVVAVNFGHPPARCARVPLRGAKGGSIGLRLTCIITKVFFCVVLSCRDRLTRLFASGEFVGAFQGFEQRVERRLSILNAAPSLDTLRALPSNCLEFLRGSRAGQYSIRINRQWRVCFTWNQGATGPSDVEIVDYH